MKISNPDRELIMQAIHKLAKELGNIEATYEFIANKLDTTKNNVVRWSHDETSGIITTNHYWLMKLIYEILGTTEPPIDNQESKHADNPDKEPDPLIVDDDTDIPYKKPEFDILWKGKLVLTLSQAAKYYGVTDNNISDNFNNNKNRFEEGIHFFKLQNGELKLFKDNTENFCVVELRANKLTLFTEYGMLLLSKSCGSNKAWTIFNKLVDTYFNKNKQLPGSFADALRAAADREDEKELIQKQLDTAIDKQKIAELEKDKAEQVVNRAKHLILSDQLIAENRRQLIKAKALNPTRIGEQLEPEQTAYQVNKALDNLGFKEKNEPIQGKEYHYEKILAGVIYRVKRVNTMTLDGHKYGEYQLTAGTKRFTESIAWKPVIIPILNDYFNRDTDTDNDTDNDDIDDDLEGANDEK